MFDPILDFVGSILAFFYELVPDYAAAIVLLTLVIMVVTTPLTLKGTRGMIKMQLMQPELKKIQEKHKGGDRQEMNKELMEFYQENNLNPLGGCLPLLVQAPFFLVLFRVIQGLTRGGESGFNPKHLEESSHLFRSLSGDTEMPSFGIDLSQSASQALGEGFLHGLPYVLLLLVMVGAQYLQQKQVTARNAGGDVMPQQKIMLRVMPAVFAVISINFAAALVVYWVTSSIYRIGLQAYITRSLYGGEDSLGAKAQAAAAAAKGKGKGSPTKSDGSKGSGSGSTKSGSGSENGVAKTGAKSGDGPAPGQSKPHPRSKKKKRKRR